MSSPAEQTIKQLLKAADVKVNGTRPWDIRVHDDRLYKRILRHGTLGAGEAYMDGWWDVPKLDELAARVGKNDGLLRNLGKRQLAIAVIHALLGNAQSKVRAKKNAAHHYNIGNNLYEAMLGETMAYSCGYWKNAKSLNEAQYAKFELVCQKLKLKPGMKVLDIGCGWGGLLFYMAEKYKVTAVGLTPASEQVAFIKEKARTRKLPVKVLQQDYREPISGIYDRIVSVGMFEHVGPKNYRTFFQRASELMKDNGIFLLHTIAGDRKTHHSNDPWVNKYIFPGGWLPSVKELAKGIEGTFLLEDWHNFGVYYDKTIMAWHRNFTKAWPKLSKNYDERFKRMWDFYLLTFAGTFRNRTCNLWQIVLSKDGLPGGYDSVR